MGTTTEEKVRENRLRRAAERQDLFLSKSRRRDPRAVDFGIWWVYKGRRVVFEGSLDGVEAFLKGDE